MAAHSLAGTPSSVTTRRWPVIAVLALAACGCGKEDVKPEPKPLLGVLELPIALRTSDALPGNAAQLEITPTAVLVDGKEVLALDKGKLPAAALATYDLAELKPVIAGKPALAIAVYAATPYATFARVVHTALTAGLHGLTFKVRRPNATAQSGWMTVPKSHFVPSPEDGKFPETDLVPWDSFVASWEDCLAACQVSARADCGYRPLDKAHGGKLDLLLRVRGSGIALRFRQAGASPQATTGAGTDLHEVARPEKKKEKPKRRKRAELLDGVAGSGGPAEQAPPEPSTEHVFTLRGDQATTDPSPVSGIVRPVCGGISCPVVLDAEGVSMSGQVLGLLGAAFPDGGPAPSVAWVLPPKN